MIAGLKARKHAKEILAQVINAFGDNPGFFDELIETLDATNSTSEHAEAIRLLCQKWRYSEEDVFRALVPESWVAEQRDLEFDMALEAEDVSFDDRAEFPFLNSTPRPRRSADHRSYRRKTESERA